MIRVHVVSHVAGGWAVWCTGAARCVKRFSNKQSAVGFARTMARRRSTELVLHRKDGSVQWKVTPR